MSVIVGRGGSYLECDFIECHHKTWTVQGDNDGQKDVRRVAQKQLGWQCMINGKDYCPDHAWKIN